MDKTLCFSRTEKGREELIGGQRALNPKQRQVLFMIGDNVSLATLAAQLPSYNDLRSGSHRSIPLGQGLHRPCRRRGRARKSGPRK